jgi:hypothetical protein
MEISHLITSKIKSSDGSELSKVIIRNEGTLPGKEGVRSLEATLPGTKSLELILYKVVKEYPLVLDIVKTYFRIYKTNYHSVTVEGVKYLASISHNEVSLEDYIKSCNGIENLRPSLINDIRRIFAFNWIMCVTSNNDNKIYIRNLDHTSLEVLLPGKDGVRSLESSDSGSHASRSIVYPFTFNERGYSKDYIPGATRTTDIANSDISEKILNKWFKGDREFFYEHVKRLIDRANLFKTDSGSPGKDGVRSLESFPGSTASKGSLESSAPGTSGVKSLEFIKYFENVIKSVNPTLLPWVEIVHNRILSTQFF